MRLARLAFLAFVAGLLVLILFIADRERQAGSERLSMYRLPPGSTLDADSARALVSTPAPYMRRDDPKAGSN
jgi:hypothetical protein